MIHSKGSYNPQFFYCPLPTHPPCLSTLLVTIFTYKKGFAINLFRIHSENKTFRIFPVRISKNHTSIQYLQVDLLEVHTNVNSLTNPLSSARHCILIRSLAALLHQYQLRFASDKQQRRVRNKKFVCRGCFATYESYQLISEHRLTCRIKHTNAG